ncbi:hypothetical protein BpHYR1_053063 [Brachionus plicatilis]|uniref:Uncharacterized protein n=1 Tax=Brachionus plicatilis TaxID=10195 RepID=A0A3M7T0J5_BRAPC|nr:hypothetical protein BpHYR1_053063 [Brachionus plicatilis]
MGRQAYDILIKKQILDQVDKGTKYDYPDTSKNREHTALLNPKIYFCKNSAIYSSFSELKPTSRPLIAFSIQTAKLEDQKQTKSFCLIINF